MEKETTAKNFSRFRNEVSTRFMVLVVTMKIFSSRALSILQFHKIILKKSKRCKEINFMLPNLLKVEHVILLRSFLAFFSLCCIK